MIVTLIVKAVLFALAGICNAVMDTLQFHYETSVFKTKKAQYWNPSISWKNKYKDGDPAKGPKFLLSTSALVFLTDGWHLFQFLMLTCFAAAAVPVLADNVFIWLGWFVGLRLIFSIWFTIFFDRILKAKKPTKD